jgi:hypothetical protein
MQLLVAVGLTIFLGGFALGYGTRALVSSHHREVARRHRLL